MKQLQVTGTNGKFFALNFNRSSLLDSIYILNKEWDLQQLKRLNFVVHECDHNFSLIRDSKKFLELLSILNNKIVIKQSENNLTNAELEDLSLFALNIEYI